MQWCRVRCRPWPPVCPVQYRTSRRYPRRLAGAILSDVCQCRDSDSHLPFQQSRQRRPHGRRVCVLGSSRTPCAWTMSTVFHGLIPFDCFSRFPSGEKCPAPAPDKPLWWPCRILADEATLRGCVALCGRCGCLATSSWMSGGETTSGRCVALCGRCGVPCHILVDETTSALCGVPAKLAVTGSARGVSSNC